MNLALSIFIIILVSFLASRLARRLHMSEVIGLIAAGLLLTLPGLEEQLVSGHEKAISGLAEVGLFTLMFLAGLEISGNLLFKEEKDALVVTFFTIITSLVLGTLVFWGLGYGIAAALIMGICFGITAEATKARALIQLNGLKTKIGALLMGTGIINDIIGVFFLFVMAYFFTHNINLLELFVLFGALSAFFAGMFAHYHFDRFSRSMRRLEKLLLYALTPFFFVNMGLSFDFGEVGLHWKILLIVILTAATGQILGVFLTKPIIRLSWRQLFVVGWGMNSKGAMELAIGYIALSIGLLPTVLYSSLVVTALVSTILFQIIIFSMVRRDPGILN